jgi:hypothetical protein
LAACRAQGQADQEKHGAAAEPAMAIHGQRGHGRFRGARDLRGHRRLHRLGERFSFDEYYGDVVFSVRHRCADQYPDGGIAIGGILLDRLQNAARGDDIAEAIAA